MTLSTVHPSLLVDQAISRLRDEIVQGHWPVGTKLPGENALARQLGVGRSTVREALRALAGGGLVQARQGAGVFVIASTPHEDWPTRLRRAAITDIYEVRMLVEVAAAELAAQRQLPEDVRGMREALERRGQAAASGNDEFVNADIDLHAAVIAAAHNPVLSGLFEEFIPLLRQGLIDLLNLAQLRAHSPAHGQDTHADMVGAIEHGDAPKAGAILRAELEGTLALLKDA